MPYSEIFRPQFHFTPQTGWMNDPNGLVYYDGEYHLFYQYTPGNIETFGAKHWGHAVSTDLIHWDHLPVALSPDPLGQIWSGSAVVDWENTSGLQTGDQDTLVAIFTHSHDGLQQQSIATSADRGRTWTKYAGNPAIANPGLKDFRDPKVFWHAPSSRWGMVLAAGDRIMFYTSNNLIEWWKTSEFGPLEGAHGGVWECPDLFPLPLDGDAAKVMWVLLVSVLNGAPNGGSGTQYFIGDFDGEIFANYFPAEVENWVDFGKDNYAGVTFSGIQDRRIFMGWMSNWYYAFKVPTHPWRGAMTLPRALNLVSDPDGKPRLTSYPIPETKQLRQEKLQVSQAAIISPEKTQHSPWYDGGALEIILEIEPGSASQFGIQLTSAKNDRILIGYDVKAQKLFVDRRDSGFVNFDSSFGGHIHAAPLQLNAAPLQLHIFLDASSIEVFGNGGRVVITDLIFPQGKIEAVEGYTLDGNAHILNLEAWALRSTWGKP